MRSIKKEDILNLSFPDEDVLICEEAKKARSVKIHEATKMGNLEYKKVTIVLDDGKERKSLFTTVWAQTKKRVFLKEKIVIPVARIVDITF